MGDIYYKVVAKSGRSMVSCCPPIGAKITYKKEKWTYPLIGTVGILVFKDLKKARAWGSSREVWECEIKGEAKAVEFLGATGRKIEDFTWSDVDAEKRVRQLRLAAIWSDGGNWINAPNGTMAVQGVKLLRKVA